jgi:hypothetical protein
MILTDNGKILMSSDGKVYSSVGALIKTQGDWQGTAVANSGEVGNVYMNTNLSVEEVNALLDNIAFEPILQGQEIIIANQKGNIMLMCINLDIYYEGEASGYAIMGITNNGSIPIFSSATEDATEQVVGVAFTGWYSDFNGVFEFNDATLNEIYGMTIGGQNYKLTNLFSSTPFTRLEGETVSLTGEYDGSTISIIPSDEELKEYHIELKPYIQEQKIPLHFKINLPNPLLKLINRTKSCSHLYQNYNFDTLSPLISGDDTINIKDFESMYVYCKYITEFPELNTSNGEDFKWMYYGCLRATSFPALNVSKGTEFNDMYSNCQQATSILMYGMKYNFEISSCKLLEAEALVTILSNCQVVTGTQTLTMGSTLLAKLEGVYVKETGVEQYEGITCRPCVICESTDTGAMLVTDYFTGKGWTLA